MPSNEEILKYKIVEVLQKMGVSAEVHERVEEGRTVFNIRTNDAQILIGKQGANLEALQHIVRLVVRKDLPQERFPFAIDIDDYKDKRTLFLKELARRAAHQVKSTGKSLSLAPMPSHERRVIHNYLSLFAGVESSSAGVDPNRKIILRPKLKEKSKDDFNFIENM